MVDIRSQTVKPKRGTDIPRISESIFEDPTFVAELHHTILDARLHLNRAKPDGWRNGWEQLKIELKDMCLKKTETAKYKASQSIKRKRKIIERTDVLVHTRQVSG